MGFLLLLCSLHIYDIFGVIFSDQLLNELLIRGIKCSKIIRWCRIRGLRCTWINHKNLWQGRNYEGIWNTKGAFECYNSNSQELKHEFIISLQLNQEIQLLTALSEWCVCFLQRMRRLRAILTCAHSNAWSLCMQHTLLTSHFIALFLRLGCVLLIINCKRGN